MNDRERRASIRAHAGGASSLLLGLGFIVVSGPLSTMVSPQSWLLPAAALMVVILGTGYLMRKLWGRTGLTVLVQAVAALGILTLAFGRSSAVLGLIPTPQTIWQLGVGFGSGVHEVRHAVAPVPPSEAVGIVTTVVLALVLILLDHIAIRRRWALVAGLTLISLGLVPLLFDAEATHLAVLLVVLVIAMALLVVSRPSRRAQRPSRWLAAGAVTGVAALVAVIGQPMLPMPTTGGSGGGGGFRATTIDPSIDLGRDLRTSREETVLRFRSDASSVPYLRMATLTSFAGDVWLPDEGTGENVAWLTDSPPIPFSGQPAVTRTAEIEALSVSSSMLPLPARARSVDNLSGSWLARPASRTVYSPAASVGGQKYSVTFDETAPTVQQLRAAGAGESTTTANAREIPDTLPDLVRSELDRVTSDEDTLYDKLMALQSWFRSSEFTYSVEAPARNGYDDAGVAAMENFLIDKSGYCVHYASTFTMMARELGAPARVVLGFLPGKPSADTVDGQRVYNVISTQLHTWPEVFFDGIGWIAFEPTASLGVPASFSNEPAPVSSTAAPTQSAAPSPTTSSSAAARDRDTDDPAVTARRAIDLRIPLTVLAVVAVLSLPAVVRIWLRSRRRRLFDNGDARAAWQEVMATATDLGVPTSQLTTVRQTAADLAERGVDLTPLVSAVEQQAYGKQAPQDRTGLGSVVAQARSSWTSQASWLRRALAVITPWSLTRIDLYPTRPGNTTEAEWSRAPSETR